MNRRVFSLLFGSGALAGPQVLANSAAPVAEAIINVPATGGILGISETMKRLHDLNYAVTLDTTIKYSGLDVANPHFDMLTQALGEYDFLKNADPKTQKLITKEDMAFVRELYSYRLQQKSLEELLAVKNGLTNEHRLENQKRLDGINTKIENLSKKMKRPIPGAKELKTVTNLFEEYEKDAEGKTFEQFLAAELKTDIEKAGGALLYGVRGAVDANSRLCDDDEKKFSTAKKLEALRRFNDLNAHALVKGLNIKASYLGEESMAEVLKELNNPDSRLGELFHPSLSLAERVDRQISRLKIINDETRKTLNNNGTRAIEGETSKDTPNNAPRPEASPANKAEGTHKEPQKIAPSGADTLKPPETHAAGKSDSNWNDLDNRLLALEHNPRWLDRAEQEKSYPKSERGV